MNSKTVIGQILRIVGLVIELWGIYGIFDQRRQVAVAGEDNPVSMPMIAIGVGFVLWISGTVLIFYSRHERSRTARDEV